MASPNLTTECTAVPQMPFNDRKEYSTETIFFEDDSSQAYQSSLTKHREITLHYENQSDAEKASFEAFWDARLGSYGVFYWNNTRTVEFDIKVKFMDSKIDFVVASARTWNWTAKIKKVI